MLLPNTELDAGSVVAERIRTAVAATPIRAPGLARPLKVTVSLGLAEFRPGAGADFFKTAGENLLAAADAALYAAKAGGRNRVSLAANEKRSGTQRTDVPPQPRP